MATGKGSDMQVYEDQFQAGWYEGSVQYADAFNARSNNAIRLVTQNRLGNYTQEAFYKTISSLITRRDLTSTTGVTSLALNTGEQATVKVNSKIGPVEMTLDAFKKIGATEEEFFFQMGIQAAQGKQEHLVNKALIAVEAAIAGQSLVYDATGQSTKTLQYTHLMRGLEKRGDRLQEVRAWVMRSNNWVDLMVDAIGTAIWNVGGVTIQEGSGPSLGRPVVMTDAAALIESAATTSPVAVATYHVLGLVENAVVIEESEPPSAVWEGPITGGEQITMRYQSEFAFNVRVAGFTWDITNGGANPTDATLGTTTNWDLTVSDVKLAAGVAVKVQ